MLQNNFRKPERGMALILSLLALLLISAVGLGMIYMSNTETSINSNYKDTQTAFFAMRAGLEEGRDRLRSNATFPLPLPTGMPPAAGSIVYIINPAGATDSVQPYAITNQYFDDEFCHESFVGSTVAWVAPGAGACNAAGAVPAGSWVTTPSESPYTNTANAMKYKWVRITLKQNATTGNPNPANATTWVDSTQAAGAQVCWDGTFLRETVATAYGAAITTCAQAKNAGFSAMPVYLVTSMALTPQGSRRVGQYEAGAFLVTPPQAGLAFDGPAATFNNAPNSNNFGINGTNSGDPANASASGTPTIAQPYQAWNGPGGQAACTSTTPASLPAIAVGDAQGVTNMDTDIPGNRTSMYTGTAPIPPAPLVPSVQNEGTGTAQYPSTNSLGTGSNWSTPAQLNQLAQAMANQANITCPSSNAACSSTTFGTDAIPRITYITGDATVSGGAGVLVVTGTLTFNGNTNFDGLILVIGQGIMNVKGGGGGQVNGEVLIANTNSHTSPFGQLAALGSPTLNWTGGGSNFIQYNSCWADYGSFIQYQLVASREEMY